MKHIEMKQQNIYLSIRIALSLYKEIQERKLIYFTIYATTNNKNLNSDSRHEITDNSIYRVSNLPTSA